MERAVFDRMADLGDAHWWFVARRRILASVIERVVRPPKAARILEIGCGTGHNLAMLSRFGDVSATELDDPAREMATARSGRPVARIALPDRGALQNGHYDLIALLDVLEHVSDDAGSLKVIHDLLKPGGAILLTVPANPWMWSAHDEAHHHYRRYRKREIEVFAQDAGLTIQLLSYFNSLLFPLVAAARFAGKIATRESSDDVMPVAPINSLLTGIFGLESYLVGRVQMPIGVSLIGVLRR